MPRPTFERILAIYLVVAALLAVLLPSHFVVERYIPIDPSLIPFASLFSRTQNALPFLTTYFLVLLLPLPLVVALLARYPQEKSQLLHQVPTLGRCMGATLILCAIAGMLFAVHSATLDGTHSHRAVSFFYLAAVSRLGLMLIGPVLLGVSVLWAYMAFVRLPQIWRGFFAGTPA